LHIKAERRYGRQRGDGDQASDKSVFDEILCVGKPEEPPLAKLVIGAA
jgi:hypothetical protein